MMGGTTTWCTRRAPQAAIRTCDQREEERTGRQADGYRQGPGTSKYEVQYFAGGARFRIDFIRPRPDKVVLVSVKY